MPKRDPVLHYQNTPAGGGKVLSWGWTGAPATDHGLLAGLNDDDHGAIYPALSQAETITGAWTFSENITVADTKTVDGVDISAHAANNDAHHNRAHNLASATDHPDVNISSPSDGQVLAYDSGTSKWINDDAVISAHVMTGAYHTASGLTIGHVIRASGATTFAWAQLQHTDLGGVTTDQHHAQAHALSGGDHTGDLAFSQLDSLIASPSFTFSTSAGAGSASTLVRSDAQVALFDATTPTTITPDTSAGTGSAGKAARRDHAHGIACEAPASPSVSLSASAEGSGSNFARADHAHQLDQAIAPTWTGSHVFQSTLTTRDIVPELTDTYDLGSSALWFSQQFVSQINAAVFSEETIQLLGGWLYIPTDAGTFAAEVGSSDTTIDFGKAMTPNDFVIVKAHDKGGIIKTEYIQVGTLVSGTTYNVTRDLAGAHGTDPVWAQGTPFAVLGYDGDGRIELNAYDSPRLQMISQGTTYNSQAEILRIGDLNGNWGYSSQTWGAAIGEYASGKISLTMDATNGLRLNKYNVTQVELTPAGQLILGDDADGEHITVDGTNGVRIYGGGYQRVGIGNDGTFWVGDTASTERLAWDGTNGLQVLNASNAAVLKVPASGDAEIIGTLTLIDPGEISAGGGNVLIDEDGFRLNVTAAYDSTSSIRFRHPTDGTLSFDQYTSTGAVGSLLTEIINKSTHGTGNAEIVIAAACTTYASVLSLQVTEAGLREISIETDTVLVEDDLRIGGGLYVGNVAGTSYTDDIVIDGGLHINVAGDPVTGELRVYSDARIGAGLVVGDTDYNPTPADINADGGIYLGRQADPGVGNVCYSGALKSYKNATEYTGYIYVPITPVKGWDPGTNKDDQALDLQASPWSLPAGIVAVHVYLGYTAGTVNNYARLMESSTGTSHVVARCPNASQAGTAAGIVNCSGGDIYFETDNATNTVYLYITGYWI